MDLTISTITVGSIIAIVGCLIAVLNYFGQRKKTNKEDEARLVRMETMLVNIDQNTTNLNNKVDAHDKLLTKHETRISVLENEISHKKEFNI